jgi:hypothetical protein
MASLLIKIGLGMFLVALIVLALALTDGMFRLWPTSLSDKELQITASSIERLRELRSQPKFHAHEPEVYRGAPNESLRLQAEGKMNAFLDQLITGLPARPC